MKKEIALQSNSTVQGKKKNQLNKKMTKGSTRYEKHYVTDFLFESPVIIWPYWPEDVPCKRLKK